MYYIKKISRTHFTYVTALCVLRCAHARHLPMVWLAGLCRPNQMRIFTWRSLALTSYIKMYLHHYRHIIETHKCDVITVTHYMLELVIRLNTC